MAGLGGEVLMFTGTLIAGGFDTLIIVFIILSVIGRMIKASKGKKKNQGAQPNDLADSPPSPQDELTNFLKNLAAPAAPSPGYTPLPVTPPVTRPVVPVARVVPPPIKPKPVVKAPPVVATVLPESDYDIKEEHHGTKDVQTLRVSIANDLIHSSSLRKGILMHEILGTPLGLR
jgi:hypothetical protein